MYYGEKLNSITHLIDAVLALIGFGSLITISVQSKDIWLITGFCVFGFTLVLLYTASTLYHSFHPPRLKKIFQKIDHVSIYLLIAGTYTPYLLVSLKEHGGIMLLAWIWGLAALGAFLDIVIRNRNETLQLAIYLLMGWSCVFKYSELEAALPTVGLVWLMLGGLAYTIGIIFYVLDHLEKWTHSHGVWHLFVLVGSFCHFVSIVGYVR